MTKMPLTVSNLDCCKDTSQVSLHLTLYKQKRESGGETTYFGGEGFEGSQAGLTHPSGGCMTERE
jgi:hypothetical protein